MIVTRDWLWLFEVCVDKLLIEGTFSRADISFSLLILDFSEEMVVCVVLWRVPCDMDGVYCCFFVVKAFCPLCFCLLIFLGVVCFSKPDKRYSMYLALNTEHMLQLFVSFFCVWAHVGDTKEAAQRGVRCCMVLRARCIESRFCPLIMAVFEPPTDMSRRKEVSTYSWIPCQPLT